MQRIVCELPKSCEIISGSCTHIGSIMCHYSGIEKTHDYILSKPNRYFLHLGDVLEAICTDDKRFNALEMYMPKTKNLVSAIPLKQALYAVKIYNPIRKRILAILRGNHERYLLKYGDLIDDIICSQLGKIPFGTEVCRIILENNGKPMFNMFAMHGKRLFNSNAKDHEQRQANKKAALKLYLQNQMGDCAVMLCGHAHWIGIVPPSPKLYFVDTPDGVQQAYLNGESRVGYIEPDRRWYACCGSARKSRLDGYDDYAQTYEANELGFVKIIIDGGQVANIEPFYI